MFFSAHNTWNWIHFFIHSFPVLHYPAGQARHWNLICQLWSFLSFCCVWATTEYYWFLSAKCFFVSSIHFSLSLLLQSHSSFCTCQLCLYLSALLTSLPPSESCSKEAVLWCEVIHHPLSISVLPCSLQAEDMTYKAIFLSDPSNFSWLLSLNLDCFPLCVLKLKWATVSLVWPCWVLSPLP